MGHPDEYSRFWNTNRFHEACDLYNSDPHAAIEEMLEVLDEGGIGRVDGDSMMLYFGEYASKYPERGQLVSKVLDLTTGDGFYVRQAVREDERAQIDPFLVLAGITFVVVIGLAIQRAVVFGLPN